MSKVNYKLVYFNARGRGEVIRFIFAQAGIEYEDKRVAGEEWAKLKPSTPTGMLPVLEVDGKQLTGSGVIARFLAERFGLAGSNDLENAEIAGILDVINDFMRCMIVMFFEKDEAKKAELKKKLEEEDVPKYWGIIEGRSTKNGSADGWIYGNKPTYADFAIYNALQHITDFVPTFADNFPHLGKLQTAVEALPNIAEWLKKRPETKN